MDSYNHFKSIMNEVSPCIPYESGQPIKNYIYALYEYYNIERRDGYDTNEIEDAIRKKIRTLLCEESNKYDLIPKTELVNMRSQVIFEYIVNDDIKEPYFGLLSFLLDSFRDIRLIIPLNLTEKWKEIFRLAKEYFVFKGWDKKEHIYDIKLQQREYALGETIKFFKKKYGIIIQFENGAPRLDTDIVNNIYNIIEKMIIKIGALNVIFSLFYNCSKKYNKELHRFLFTRNFDGYYNKNPDMPVGFIFNTCVKHIKKDDKRIISNDYMNDIPELIELIKRYCSLFDFQSYNQWEDINIPYENLPEKMQEFALYDSVFNIDQFNPLNMRKLLNYLFSHLDSKKTRYNINQYINVICDIIEYSPDLLRPLIINKNALYKKYKLLLTGRIDEILNFFSHKQSDINNNYCSPFDYKYCDFPNKPLIKIDKNNFLLLNSAISSMAVYESIMSDLRKKIKSIESDTGRILEEAVKHFFVDNNINVISGKYKNSNDDCDVIIESGNGIVFIEVKKKALTRSAKSGDDVNMFIDFSKSLIDSLIQLNKHEINLREKGILELKENIIEFKDRKIEKVSLVLHDFGTVHDKMIFDQILRNMEYGGYEVYDQTRKEKFNEVIIKSNKLKRQIDKLISLDAVPSNNPHINCYFLCLDQLLMIINDSNSNESFVSNLQSIRNITLYNHNIYETYLYAKTLKNYKKII